MMNKKNAILKERKAELFRAERVHIFQIPAARYILLLLCIAADAFTIFNVFDLMMEERVALTLVITVAVAAVMNITPMLIAAVLRSEEIVQHMKNFFLIGLTAVFAVFFLSTFCLRMTTMEMMFQSKSSLSISIVTEENQEESEEAEKDEKPTAGEIVVAVVMGLEPIGTSAVCFYLSYEEAPGQKKKHKNAIYAIALRDEIDRYTVMLHELEEDMSFDLDAYDEEHYQHMIDTIRSYGEEMKVNSRKHLSMKEASPEGVGFLMEGGYLRETGEGLPESVSA